MVFANEDGEWQLVRYGRRGRPRGRTYDSRPRNQDRLWSSGDRGGMGAGGKARAIPDPRWRGRANPSPNQPVPPFGVSSRPRPSNPWPPRNWRPQTRTYADVVRQANPGRAGNNWNFGFGQGSSWNWQQGRYFQPRRDQQSAPVDPKFGRLVRQLKKVIKIVHHLQNVTEDTGKPQPQMISRMVEILANMIKPAAPNSRTMDMIEGNAKNWGYTTLIILQDHYRVVLDEALKDLTQDPGLDWKAAFEVATRWARRNLPRLPRDVVDHAEALVTAVMVPEAHGPQKPNPQGDEEQTQETLGLTRRRHRQEDPSQVQFLEEVVTPPPQTTIQQEGGQQTRRPNTRDESSQVEPLEGLPAPHPSNVDQSRKEEQTQTIEHPQTQTQGKTRQQLIRDASPEIVELGEEVLVDTGVPVTQQPPKEQRAKRRDWSKGPLEDGDQQQWDHTPTLTPTRTITVEAQVLRDPIPEDSWTAEDLENLGDSVLEDVGTEQVPIPQPTQFGPTRHIRTDRKMVDWTLSVSKKWLIIGDSNLSRLPHHGIPNLQIDSFPGANFRHMGAVLSKAVVQVLVEKVLISCGLNSRGQKFKETTVKQLQTALRMARRRFPYAEIWIPLVNYSTALPEREQRNLIQLNTHIYKNMPYICHLPTASFQTEQDNIHWTRETGKAMFDHWATALNLKAP